MKLILGEGSNAALFRDEKGESDDENSGEEDKDADFESVANLQYLRLGEFGNIFKPVTHPLCFNQGTVRQKCPTAGRQNPKTGMQVVMKAPTRRQQNPLWSLMHPILGQLSIGRTNLAQKHIRPFNEVSRRIYEWTMSCWNSRRSGCPTMLT